MARKVVTVDEGLHLPSAVQAQLKADLETEFTALTEQAEEAAAGALGSAQTALEAAAEATAPTDDMIASLVGDPNSDTYLAMSGLLGGDPQITDAIQEWWIYPVATYLTTPTPRTVFGAISSTGKILACERNEESRQTRRFEVGTAVVDDHNSPALYAEDGHRLVIAWTNHNGDNLIHLKVGSADGDVASLESAPLLTWDSGSVTSYTQIHRIESLSSSGIDVFWLFFRRSTTTWYYVPVTVDQSDGSVTWGTQQHLLGGGGVQCYISTAPSYSTSGNEKIRMAWGWNPNASRHDVFYLEIDTVTGAITNPQNGAFSANMSGTNLPIVAENLTAILPDTAGTDSRRLHYVRSGPAYPAISYAEWVVADPDNAVYKVTRATNAAATTWTQQEYGISGPRIGYTDTANYIGGVSFPEPCTSDVVAVARNLDGVGSIDLYHTNPSAMSRTRVVRGERVSLARPMWVRNGGPTTLMYSQIDNYGTSYTDYLANIKFSEDEAADVTSFATDTSDYSAYTPTLTASTTNPSMGTGATLEGEYKKIGTTVRGRFNVVAGTGFSPGSGTYVISLPFTAVGSGAGVVVGSGWLNDSSNASSGTYVFSLVLNAAGTGVVMRVHGGSTITGAAPVTMAVGDGWRGQFEYRTTA